MQNWFQKTPAILKAEIHKNPENCQARKALALSLRKSGRWQEAIYELNQVLERYPDDDFAHSLLSQVLYKTGAFTEALFHANKAIQIRPENHFPYTTRAEIYLKQGHIEEAITSFEAALPFAPDNLYIVERLVSVFRQTEQWQRARQLLEQALITHDGHPKIKSLWSEINEKMTPDSKPPQKTVENIAPAESTETKIRQLCQQIDTMTPKAAVPRLHALLRIPEYEQNAALHALLAKHLKTLKRFPEAAKAYARATELEPTSDFYVKQYGFALNRARQFQKVIEIFEPFIKKSVSDPYVVWALANAYLCTDQVESAQRLLIRSLEKNPNDQMLRKLLMKCRNK